jgi:2-polyprenyl-3-methyl-5-hydroxy-6-metoxy-1,4-benzoquinol methylase
MSNKNIYYSQTRSELLQFIDKGKNKVLEIGCGEGNTLLELKNAGKAKYTAGIDIHRPSIRKASKVVDLTIVGNIEELVLPFQKEVFDYIILADVLEHLIDPWSRLGILKSYLKPGGAFIISVPNIRNINVIKDLILKNNWRYDDKGILDRTHLRFFTHNSIVEILENEGLIIETERDNSPELNRFTKIVDWISGGRVAPFYVVQFLIKAVKTV